MEDSMQPESLSQEEAEQPVTSLIQETKPSRRNLTTIILAVFLVIFLGATAGLGYWAYTLNSSLIAKQQQLAELQSDYAKLQSGNENLTTELAQVKTDLEESSKDLTNTQTKLEKMQDENLKLKVKIEAASKKLQILYAFSTVSVPTDILAIDTMIKATEDKQLLERWNDFYSTPSASASVEFILNLITATQTSLK
jgi:septal ring factor EnvC (AmiA/AmiB activator)